MPNQSVAPISSHAQLRNLFQNALKGVPLFRFGFFPEKKTRKSLWVRIICPLILLTYFLGAELKDARLIALAVLLQALWMYLVECEIQRGATEDLSHNHVLQNLEQHPFFSRRHIMHHAYFVESLDTCHATASLAEIASVLKVLEMNRSNRPPGWTALLRHPMVVAIFVGVLIYAFNFKIMGAASKIPDWNTFALVFCGLSVFLWLASMMFKLRYLAPWEEWRFERSLRWYLLEKESPKKIVKCSRRRPQSKR